jgi:hypothetical protein
LGVAKEKQIQGNKKRGKLISNIADAIVLVSNLGVICQKIFFLKKRKKMGIMTTTLQFGVQI